MADELVAERSGVAAQKEVAVKIIDADIHPSPRTPDELRGYVPEPWRSQQWSDEVFNAIGSPIYEAPNKAQRLDSYAGNGGPPCSDPEFTARQLFSDAGVDLAIHIPLTVRPTANPEHEAAVCAATNSWLKDTWLTRYNKHGRYYGTLRVCSGDPQLAVREIERWAGDEHFVQVMLNPYNDAPLGQARYYPIYETATRLNLPIGLHVNRSPGMRLLTPVGFSSYFFEHHALYSMMYMAHLTSLVFEGVFERFPTLRFSFIEGGFSWLVPLMWRLDRHWEHLGSEVPNVRRKPSEYIREHVRISTQPIEEPEVASDLARLWDWVDPGELLMFATDYPHWDFDAPGQVNRFPESARKRILMENAREWYGLPATRAADPGQ